MRRWSRGEERARSKESRRPKDQDVSVALRPGSIGTRSLGEGQPSPVPGGEVRVALRDEKY